MAKVTAPLFSIEASGKFGDSMVFGKWKGINYVRMHTKANQPNTKAQLAVRDKFRQAAALYQRLTGDDKAAWKRSASGQPLTGYNLFIKTAKAVINSMPVFNLISAVEIEEEAFDSCTISFMVDKDGPVIIRYGESPQSLNDSSIVMATANEINFFDIEDLDPEKNYYFQITQETQYLQPPSNMDAYTVGIEGDNTILYGVTAVADGRETYANMAHLSSIPDTADMDENNFVELNWQPVDGADEYRIYRMEATGDHEKGLVAINEFANFQDTGEAPIKPGKMPPEENNARLFAGETGTYSFQTL